MLMYLLIEFDLLKHLIVFFNKQAIVIGPTPPGTGVMAFTPNIIKINISSDFIVRFINPHIYDVALLTVTFHHLTCSAAEIKISARLHSDFKSLDLGVKLLLYNLL